MKSYDQIIVAGHSLGSVIAYDALNRVIQETNARRVEKKEASKIIGLVTLGSPLDKLAFFFQVRTDEDKRVQRQILAHLHKFRAYPLEDKKDGIILISGEFRGLGVAHSCYWGANYGKNNGEMQKKASGTDQIYRNIVDEFFP